jgi:hypothetical protein
LLFCWLTSVEIIELKINLRLPNNVHVYCVYIDFELTSVAFFVLVSSFVGIDGPCDDDVFLFLLAELKINLRLPNYVHVYCVYIDFEFTSVAFFVAPVTAPAVTPFFLLEMFLTTGVVTSSSLDVGVVAVGDASSSVDGSVDNCVVVSVRVDDPCACSVVAVGDASGSVDGSVGDCVVISVRVDDPCACSVVAVGDASSSVDGSVDNCVVISVRVDDPCACSVVAVGDASGSVDGSVDDCVVISTGVSRTRRVSVIKVCTRVNCSLTTAVKSCEDTVREDTVFMNSVA